MEDLIKYDIDKSGYIYCVELNNFDKINKKLFKIGRTIESNKKKTLIRYSTVSIKPVIHYFQETSNMFLAEKLVHELLVEFRFDHRELFITTNINNFIFAFENIKYIFPSFNDMILDKSINELTTINYNKRYDYNLRKYNDN